MLWLAGKGTDKCAEITYTQTNDTMGVTDGNSPCSRFLKIQCVDAPPLVVASEATVT